MIVAAKIISILIMVKGFFFLIFPGYTRNMVEYFNRIDDKYKRVFGALMTLAGLLLLYFSRTELLVPLVHWVISVSGIYFVPAGLIISVFPSVVGKISTWFYSEKGPVSLTGFILLAGGTTLFILL